MSGDDTNPTLNRIIADYLQALEGDPPLREELISRYPHLAGHLQSFFAYHDAMRQAAGETSEAPTRSLEPSLAEDVPGPQSPVQKSTLPHSAAESVPESGTILRYFGDYELLEEIGRGGMGVVYKARQVSLNRIVAVKMILAGQLATEEDVKRFCREAEAAGSLDHPGIVPIYEIGEREGQHYFSMGFVEGESLAERIKDGPLSLREAAEYVRMVAEAVTYAHGRGVIHRDLKPANVLLDQNNVPRVTDFGLAKRVKGDGELTTTGQVLGTPSYMPPEQASGKLDEVGELSDIYSLGALLYALLTGRPPFQAASQLDTLMQVLERVPISPRDLNAAVDRDLETICLKCLEKDIRKRYPSAVQLSEELQRFLKNEPIHARPISRAARMWRWCKRNPIGATVVVLLVLLAVGGPLVAMREASLRVDVQRARKVADDESKRATDEANRAYRHLYVAHMHLAHQAWKAENVGRVLELLEQHRHGRLGQDDLRSFDWYYLWRLCRRDVMSFNLEQTRSLRLTFSPDGKLLASAGVQEVLNDPMARQRFEGPGTLRWTLTSHDRVTLWDVAAGVKRATLYEVESGLGTSFLAFSPDGKTLAYANVELPSDMIGKSITVVDAKFYPQALREKGTISTQQLKRRVRLFDVATATNRHTIETDSELGSLAFSRDSKTVALNGRRGEWTLYDTSTGRERTLEDTTITRKALVPASSQVREVVSPDGRIEATASGPTIELSDLSTGRERGTLKGHSSDVSALVFWPDGKTLVSASKTTGTVKRWDLSVLDEPDSLTGNKTAVTVIGYSPDGKTIASGSIEGSIKLWDLSSGNAIKTLQSEDPPSLLGHKSEVYALAFSPDGKTLASGGSHHGGDAEETLTLWDIPSGRQLKILTAPTERAETVNALAFSPDGNTLASGGNKVRLWNVSSGKQRAVLDKPFRIQLHGTQTLGPINLVYSIAFSPDGQKLASLHPGGVFVWNTDSGDALVGFPNKNATGFREQFPVLAFNGNLLAVSDPGGTIRLWDVTAGNLRRALERLPDLPSIPSGPDYSHRYPFDGLSGALLRAPLTGHGGPVRSISFCPDGKTIASGSADNTVKLWNVLTGEETLTLRGHSEAVNCIAFSPDGRTLLSGSEDTTIRLWRAASEEEVLAQSVNQRYRRHSDQRHARPMIRQWPL